MVEVEHLMAMSDNAGELIDEMVRWKYEVAQVVLPIRSVRIGIDSQFGGETYGQWFERVFYEDLTEYRARAREEKIGEKIAAKTQEDRA